MNIDTDAIIIFCILWGTPLITMLVTYLKMSPQHKREARRDFCSAHFLCTIGAIAVGVFTASLGNLLHVLWLTYSGIALLSLGTIGTIITTWKDSKTKSLIVPLFLVVYVWWVL